MFAIERLEYLWPDRWEALKEYDTTEIECRVFGHVCPVFFNKEPATETKESRRFGRYIPREIMLKVVRRDGQVCQVCHKNVSDNELEFDHVIPFSHGGPVSVENLRVLCSACNGKKRDKLGELLEPKEPDEPIA
ncbi:MAG: HNH endonuclease [Verrucomicrobia bacterium]|nr:HNH endonuclease [Verrucomicrobiota bacterium]